MGHDAEEEQSLGSLGIISNPKEHKLRKLSAGEKEKDLSEIVTKTKHSFSKFDKYDPFLNTQRSVLNQLKYGVSSATGMVTTPVKNKFDLRFYTTDENSSLKNVQGRRPKAYSIHHHRKPEAYPKSSKFVPLNKDYHLSSESNRHIFIYIS
jgi:hypothetical protein